MPGNILNIIFILKAFPALASIASYFQSNTKNTNMIYCPILATPSSDLKSLPDHSLNCTPLRPITITNRLLRFSDLDVDKDISTIDNNALLSYLNSCKHIIHMNK